MPREFPSDKRPIINKRRSTHAQILAMQRRWPLFSADHQANGIVTWYGPLKPRAQVYWVRIVWWSGRLNLPLVFVLNPRIEPAPGGTYEQIPHLIVDSDRPEMSALCLFDPDGNEWSPADLIAETTVEWVCEWLHYYELWHATGEWLAPSVGHSPVDVAVDAAQAFRDTIQHVH
jgi:hypothetical protein